MWDIAILRRVMLVRQAQDPQLAFRPTQGAAGPDPRHRRPRPQGSVFLRGLV